MGILRSGVQGCVIDVEFNVVGCVCLGKIGRGVDPENNLEICFGEVDGGRSREVYALPWGAPGLV